MKYASSQSVVPAESPADSAEPEYQPFAKRPLDALKQIERVLAPEGTFVTETKLSQLLSHPQRSRGRRLPIPRLASMRRHRTAWLWETWVKVQTSAA